MNEDLLSLLTLNNNANKSHTAIKKTLKYHPTIDMGPMFEWDAEEGEQNLKALPYVTSWFERAGEAILAVEDGERGYNIEERKLDVIYQFARAMPYYLFLLRLMTNRPVTNGKGGKVCR